MLKYNYSLNISSNKKRLFLDDIYISPDLAFVSGTSSTINSCQYGERVVIDSPDFPGNLYSDVTYKKTVKRNGYVMVPLTLPVHLAKIVNDEGDIVNMYYVEYKGNTYYSKIGTKTFIINGVEYVSSDISTLEIMDIVYVEDNKLIVNGITYDATINNKSQLLLHDISGKPFLPYNSWDMSNITSASTYVDKLFIGNNYPQILNCNSITYYGHMAYAMYCGEKYYFEYLKDESGSTIGYGVIVDGEQFLFGNDEDFNIYDETDYYETIESIVDNDMTSSELPDHKLYIIINDSKCLIHFEPCQIRNSGIICIETESANIPIQVNDIITVKSTEPTTELVVKYESNGDGYVYFNGKRYDVIKNLCDSVNIGGGDFILNIESAGTNSNIESITIGDGSKMYFEIIPNDSGKIAKKVEFVNNKWQYINSVQLSGNTKVVIYGESQDINVDEHDGVQLDDYKAQVRHYDNIINDGEGDNSIDLSYDYVIANTQERHKLIVINVVGNNKFLCIPDVSPYLYVERGLEDMKFEILDSIVGKSFVIELIDNRFGRKDLYFDTWLKDAYDFLIGDYANIGTSTYDLSNIIYNLKMFLMVSSFEFPIKLSNTITNKLMYDDLVIDKIYPIEEEKAINRIVDMEKDLYEPIDVNPNNGFNLPVKTITFNFHFRTRDLDTWKIIDDDGELNGQKMSANYEYCNYFITDYYPYYNYVRRSGAFSENSFKYLINNSDLLGFLWFTTDDVKMGAPKLKKSFLRLTYFDSKNPEKQNMLGTSTIYFDCDRYFDSINRRYDKDGTKLHYELASNSRQPDRSGNNSNVDNIPVNGITEPGVTKECFHIVSGSTNLFRLAVGESELKLDSRIVVKDRYSNMSTSSEGYNAYILKEFANKNKKQTIYMKAEFFHAGLGIKIPMIIPTKKDGNDEYSAINTWDENTYNDFISGYDLNSVFDRLYIPLTIEYLKSERKFVYSIGEENNYLNTISTRFVNFTTEPGRYNSITGEPENDNNSRRIATTFRAPLKVLSLNHDYVFSIYRYNSSGYVSPSYFDREIIELTDTDYTYKISFRKKEALSEITDEEVKNNYIIEQIDNGWIFNLFELKIKPQ